MFDQALQELRQMAQETGISPQGDWHHGIFADPARCLAFYEKYRGLVRMKWALGTQIIFVCAIPLEDTSYCSDCERNHD